MVGVLTAASPLQMDRTSILGDTIDYVKEPLDKISTFREENEMQDEIKEIKFMGNFKELKPNEAFVRNPPKGRMIIGERAVWEHKYSSIPDALFKLPRYRVVRCWGCKIVYLLGRKNDYGCDDRTLHRASYIF
ncbi:hypothetical protein P3S68_032117 [Capsicum galapagoense]